MKPPINKVGFCLIREEKLLVARNHNADLFQIPGGKIEAEDEDNYHTLRREIQEELSVDVDMPSVNYIGKFSDVAATDPNRIVNIELYSGEIHGEIQEDNEIAELKWFDIHNGDVNILSKVVGSKIIPHLRSKI